MMNHLNKVYKGVKEFDDNIIFAKTSKQYLRKEKMKNLING